MPYCTNSLAPQAMVQARKESLTLSGSTLYGMTSGEAPVIRGTIFKIGIDGSGYSQLHSFSGGGEDGKYPLYSSLVISGSFIYGATRDGGDLDYGTIFKIGTNGSGFSLLHEFNGGTEDGVGSCGGLFLSGTTFIGTTHWGGDTGRGTIFSVDISGAPFSLLHEFGGGAGDGAIPFGTLIASGANLFGMTVSGGGAGKGVIFSPARFTC